jgi:hypothetical protein
MTSVVKSAAYSCATFSFCSAASFSASFALDIFRQAEENGFVHQITNIDGKDKIFAICNCNVNVCYALRTSQLFNTPNMSRSAYIAKVEKQNCVACGKCVEAFA